MLEWNCETVIVKFDYVRPLTPCNFGYTLADPKISFDFKQPANTPYVIFYVSFFYSSDDEYGGSIDFEAKSTIKIYNNRQKFAVGYLLEIVKHSMKEVNTAFKHKAATYGFGLTYQIAAFKNGTFSDYDLRNGIKQSLYEFFKSNPSMF
ncbi:MAG TPA: hypothetical protein VM187_03575 [Niastella sp.]|nr:hypothetical protein [Niastella sp.]